MNHSPSATNSASHNPAGPNPAAAGSLRRLFRAVRAFRADERGATAIIVGLSLVALTGMIGLGVEVGSWYAAKRHLQSAADAAAIGAAYDLYEVGDSSGIQAAAEADAARNGVAPGADLQIAAVSPPTNSANFNGNALAVQVTIDHQPNLLLAALFQNTVSLEVDAVAEVQILGEACILALSSTVPVGIELTGSANLNLDGCGMFSNATSPTSMTTAGGAQLQVVADFFAMVGGFDANGSADPVLDMDINDGEPITGATKMQDPYADYVSAPAPGTTYDDPQFNTGDTWAATGAGNAAHFDEGLTFRAQANVTIPSSVTEIYVTGELKINAGAVINCTCTFVLIGNESKITINGGANINITAPSADDVPAPRYPGIAFYNSAADSTQTSTFSGTADTTIVGSLYFPNQAVKFQGTSAGGSKCTRIVAKSMVFIGNTSSTIQPGGSNCPKGIPGVDLLAKSVPVLVE